MGGGFGQVAARGGGWCSRSLRLFHGLWGWAKEHARSRWRRPWRWRAGHFAPLVPGQGTHRAVGQCADAAGEGARTRPRPPGAWGRPTRTGSRWCARPGSPIALAPLLADDQAASPPPVPRSSIVRAPARSTACPRPGGSQPAGWVSASARPAAGGSTIPCSTRLFIGMACGSTCTVVSWLIARPSAAGEPAHGAPPRCTPRP